MTTTNTPPPRRRRRPARTAPGVVGYVRVSTDEQAASGAGLDAQRKAIADECERRGLPMVAEFADEGASGAQLDRPGLVGALDMLDRGDASVLMVAKLDRLTRSVAQAYDVMDRSRRSGWAIVAIDLSVDTTTPAGEMMAGVASVFAQFERRLIGQRTRDALAIKKAQGVQLGRPRSVADETRTRIAELRASGLSWRAVADELNVSIGDHPTGQGAAEWKANTCRRIYLADHPDAA